MKLRKDDIEILKGWGHNDEDINQIQEFANHGRIEYKITNVELNVLYEKIGVKKAISVLGRKEWLSGVERATFHWTACRECNGNEIYFDASKYWCKLMKEA